MHAFVVAELNLQQLFQKYNKKFQLKNKLFFLYSHRPDVKKLK